MRRWLGTRWWRLAHWPTCLLGKGYGYYGCGALRPASKWRHPIVYVYYRYVWGGRFRQASR